MDRSVLAVIPARYASTRLPGKAIMPLAGKPLVQHTYERTCRASLVHQAVVATDDERVAQALAPYGTPVVMTDPNHPTGTDRIAEVARQRDEALIVNVQGDEPLIDPATIDNAIRPLLERPDVVMSTAKHRIARPEDALNPNIVKVVCDATGLALYFSRAPIPHVRDATPGAPGQQVYWQHIGLYVYRRDFLLQYPALPQTPLEQLEKLEQLRALENGYKIVVVETEYKSIGVDVLADYEHVQKLLEGDLSVGA
jgi:3-deoxy-manno-octulosonate cytidylyltransferase (CMP-KDO synthetase)